MQHMAAADGKAVDRGDQGLGQLAYEAVQVLDLEQAGARGSVIPRLAPLLLIAAGAKRALAGARQADHADRGVRPGALQAADHLLYRLGPEGVEPLRPVDRDRGQATLDLLADVGHRVLHVIAPGSTSR